MINKFLKHTIWVSLTVLSLGVGWVYFNPFSEQVRALFVPKWPIMSAHQPNTDDWVTVELISPVSGEPIVDTNEVILNVQYSLQSRAEATLILQLRHRLDLDLVDLGSSFSNLIAMHDMTVQQGVGEETITLAVDLGVLNQFPPDSEIVPIATLHHSFINTYSRPNNGELFQQAYAGAVIKVPDRSEDCVFDETQDSFEVSRIISPASQESPYRVQVEVVYDLSPAHAEIATLVGGLVQPSLESDNHQRQLDAYSYSELEMPSGTLVLDVYPTWDNLDERLVLALGLVCGRGSFLGEPQISYFEVFPEHVFEFSD